MGLPVEHGVLVATVGHGLKMTVRLGVTVGQGLDLGEASWLTQEHCKEEKTKVWANSQVNLPDPH